MNLEMSTCIRTLGDIRTAFKHFEDDLEITIDPASPNPNEENIEPSFISASYEYRCDDKPRIYLSYVLKDEVL